MGPESGKKFFLDILTELNEDTQEWPKILNFDCCQNDIPDVYARISMLISSLSHV